MEYITDKNRIYALSDSGEVIAEILFPDIGQDKCEITRTFVDESLRGRGIAGELMNRAVAEIKSRGKTPVPVCSYAVSWMDKHKE